MFKTDQDRNDKKYNQISTTAKSNWSCWGPSRLAHNGDLLKGNDKSLNTILRPGNLTHATICYLIEWVKQRYLELLT